MMHMIGLSLAGSKRTYLWSITEEKDHVAISAQRNQGRYTLRPARHYVSIRDRGFNVLSRESSASPTGTGPRRPAGTSIG